MCLLGNPFPASFLGVWGECGKGEVGVGASMGNEKEIYVCPKQHLICGNLVWLFKTQPLVNFKMLLILRHYIFIKDVRKKKRYDIGSFDIVV
jgi:hypothetical protein